MYPEIHLHQAVYKRLTYTIRSIESIGERTHYPNFRWTVSDIGNHPWMTEHLKQLQGVYGFEVVKYAENVGQWHACEAAWGRSEAPLLSHIQNDIIVPHGWLFNLHEVYQAFHPFLVGAWHHPVAQLVAPNEHNEQGIGLINTPHLAGTSFLLSRADWRRFGKIDIGHAIYGFTAYQVRAAKAGARIGYAYPPVKVIHMDQGDYPHSLRETEYKEYTDEIFRLRHGKERPAGVYP